MLLLDPSTVAFLLPLHEFPPFFPYYKYFFWLANRTKLENNGYIVEYPSEITHKMVALDETFMDIILE